MTTTDNKPEGTSPLAEMTALSSSPNLDSTGQALRRQAEKALRERIARDQKSLVPMSAEETRLVLHELQVHQIELQFQNEELRRVLAELDASRERYIDFYDMAPVGYCTLTEEGLLLKANLTAASILGVVRRELAGQRLSRFIKKEDQDVYWSFRQDLFKTGDARSCQLRMMKNGGTTFWAQLNAIVVREPSTTAGQAGGAPVGRVVLSDISELKEAENGLRESEQDFMNLVNSGMAMIWTSGTDKLCNYFNSVWLEFTGRTLEQEMDHGWVEGVHPDDRRRCLDLYVQAFDRQEKFSMEYRLQRHDGQYRWIVDEGCPRYDSRGKFLGYIGHCLDIDERKQAEEALQESEARFKLLHNASFGGICIHDKGIILDCNQGLSEMTGYSNIELIGMDGLLLISEKCRDKVMNNILSGYEKPYEALGVRKNNEEYPLRLEARIVPWKGKKVRSVEFRDITELKQTEEAKIKLESQLQHAQKMESIGLLAGGVAHDFNNMLGVIIGYSELILDEINPSQQFHTELKEIQKAARRSTDLTRQLLTFARKQMVSPKVLDLNQTIEGMLNMLRRLIGEHINLVWMPGTSLWPIEMDPSQIDQILANLCVNARDAITSAGQIVVETENTSFSEEYCTGHSGVVPGEYVRIAVSDNGSGIDAETLAHIFEPFFTTKNIGEGTGLGLASVYGAIKQNNGFINAYSEPGLGTTFTIYIPRYIDKTTETRTTTSEEPVLRGNETIMLVEDEPTLLIMTRTMLERLGYTVLPAATPSEAMRLVSEFSSPIDLLVTDVIMPEMNGRMLAERLAESRPAMKHLFMSGYTANIIASQGGALSAGVSFIQKPFSKKELALKIRAALEATSSTTS